MPRPWFCFLAVTVLGGCANLPTGPSVMVLPSPGKSFEQFQADDGICRQWAMQQVGGPPGASPAQNMAVGAVAGTALGTAVGAALGAASGHAGTGAAIGAGTGLLAGTAVGANVDQAYGWNAQHRYDIAYQQCMYAKGNLLPGAVRGYWRPSAPASFYPPPPPRYPSASSLPPSSSPPAPVESVPTPMGPPPPPTP